MKRITLIFLTINAISTFGQTANETMSSDYKKVQFGINISPDICFRTLKNNDTDPSNDFVLDERNKNETFKLGYTGGLNVCYNFNKNIGLEAGIQYSNRGYQSNFLDIINGQSEPHMPNKMKFIYNYYYLDIPLKINYSVGKKKVRFFASLGFSTNILMTANESDLFIYSDHALKKTFTSNYDYSKLNLTPIGSVGIDYKINNRMNLRVEPTFRYGVFKIIDTPITGYLYSGGLNVSYFFGF